jgi:3-deoxy-7-phosphoheptulonate synthase
MFERTDDLRIESLRPLLSPAILEEEIPTTEATAQAIAAARAAVADVVQGRDRRLVVVVGPCSVHDPAAALEYAQQLKGYADRFAEDLVVVMRTYFEKPRTTVGWKGLINDPSLDGTFRINQGLRVARGLLRDLAELGLPTGTEFLDPISPQFVADLVAWGAIGARTTESQVHREMASGLSMPVGFKNGTGGNVQIAIDAVRSSRERHHFLGVTKEGISAIVATRGNPDCHVILRGGTGGPNYDAESVQRVASKLERAGLAPRVMVDCSHANSGKDHERQPAVAETVAEQVAEGSSAIAGLMLESFLLAGKQKAAGPEGLVYGQSITDACMDIDTTGQVLERLARAAAQRAKR